MTLTERQRRLRELIMSHASYIQPEIPWANAERLLASFAEVESSFGLHAIPRYEPAYGLDGRYYNKEQHDKWGAWAACSYSSFQIMYPVAIELGFNGTPIDLFDDNSAILWAIEYIRKRGLKRGAKSISDLADCYNSGSFKDNNRPMAYIDKILKAYDIVGDRYQLFKETV